MEPIISVENRAGLTAESFDRLAKAVSLHRSIKHALDWVATHDPALSPTDMVTQDEFSHDILAAYADGLWLVYDCT